MTKRLIAYLLCYLMCCVTSSTSWAVHEKKDGFPWNMPYKGYHEQPIIDALGSGFFMNIGPTGMRARITREQPMYFTIKFVFKKSPAYGKVKAGDIVIGANNKIMNVAHKFGRRTVTGMNGPMTEMAKLIEAAQAKDGKLDLIVWPGGDKGKQKTVSITLKKAPAFSPNYPFDCQRSDELLRKLCDFLVSEYEREGGFKSRVHTHSACVLALMASGDRRYDPLIQKIMSRYGNKKYSANNGGGFPVWGWGYDGIVMGEYYLKYRDRSVLPAMASLAEAFELGQDWRSGGYSHKPFPYIQKRIASGGPKGYGAMSQTGGLAMIAQALFRAGGVTHSESALNRLHHSFLFSWNPAGTIGYGFNGWEHAVIELQDPGKSPAKTELGIGYECKTGMKDIGPYKISWPTTSDKRYKDTSWIKSEASTNRVYDMGGAQRMVVRQILRPEPTGPYPISGKHIMHYGRSGQGAIAHFVGEPSKEWQWLGAHYANACASSPGSFLEGHASSLMGALWGSLGASFAEPKRFQQYMQGIKWWFIMAETHNGGFVTMPGRDYAATDNYYGGRNLPTATSALILSVKHRQLQITGAEGASLGGASSGGFKSASSSFKSTSSSNRSTSRGPSNDIAVKQAAANKALKAAREKNKDQRGNRARAILTARKALKELKEGILKNSSDPEYIEASEIVKALKAGGGSRSSPVTLEAESKLREVEKRILENNAQYIAAKEELNAIIRNKVK